MPTILLHNVVMTGAPAALEAVAADAGWRPESHAWMFSLDREENDPASERLRYRFDDDYKRPGPEIGELAARHPEVRFMHEYLDEHVSVCRRAVYTAGVLEGEVDIDPDELDWVVWNDG